MCFDSPDPPDYSGVANANAEAARLAKQSADADLAFRKEQWNATQGLRDNLTRTATEQADLQSQIARDSKTRSDAQWSDYEKTFRPLEQQVVSDAQSYDSADAMQQAADRATSDVATAANATRGATARRMASMGINVADPRYVASDRASASAELSARAAAANNARTGVKDKAIALRAGAANFGRNMPNTSSAAYSTAIAAGTGATNVANTGANGSLAAVDSVGRGYTSGINAANVSGQLNLGYGNLLNSTYRSQLAADSSGGLMSGIGGLMQGAGMLYQVSSKRAKTQKRRAAPVLDRLNKLKVEDWKYKDGVADGGQHTGPYAEDMQRQFGNKAAPGGRMIDIISANGITIKAVQELSHKVDKLAKRVDQRKQAA